MGGRRKKTTKQSDFWDDDPEEEDNGDEDLDEGYQGMNPGGGQALIGTSKGAGAKWAGWSPSFGARCYSTHPPYEVAPGLVIYGGSCVTPAVTDADVYVGLDWGMQFQAKPPYPWSAVKNDTGPVEFMFRISDMKAPADEVEFRNMVVWLGQQLQAGKKVHVGCIGGHGRTGTLFAALRAHLMQDPDPITHVRQNYCEKAVESLEQIEFLAKYYGAKPVMALKAALKSGGHGHGKSVKTMYGKIETVPTLKVYSGSGDPPVYSGDPVRNGNSVWGD